MQHALIVLVISSLLSINCGQSLITDEEQAKHYLVEANDRLAVQMRQLEETYWNYLCNITDHTSNAFVSHHSHHLFMLGL